eukprot:GHVQ01041495.1.p1 GENE.GHVQ01041495.1~~GHVQ01041495.1.p1  ORF type:complete len:234 (+),score=36.56 GHVQ01041495.1:183-884(+)
MHHTEISIRIFVGNMGSIMKVLYLSVLCSVCALAIYGIVHANAAAEVETLKGPSGETVTAEVYFDIAIDGKPAGRVEMGLFGEVTPLTADNFLQLCKGWNAPSGDTLTYKESIFHRVIPNFMLQGGDFTNHNGTGGTSIYGARFADENFIVKHTRHGLLSMANAGPGTNGSQFFITTVATPWLDGKHVVFGVVTSNYELVQTIEALGSQSGKPSKTVKIIDSGVLREGDVIHA